MRNCDLLNEIEPEARPCRAHVCVVPAGTSEGFEDSPHGVWRNATFVVDIYLDLFELAAHDDSDWLTVTMLNRVPHKVRRQLCEPVTIPVSLEVPERIEAEGAAWVVLPEIVEYVLAHTQQIYRSPRDAQPDPEARSGQINELAQHSIDAFCVDDDPRGHSRRLVVDPLRRRKHLREQSDGGERGAQVVAEDHERLIPELLQQLAVSGQDLSDCRVHGLIEAGHFVRNFRIGELLLRPEA
jgi:hypothetical protein